MKEIYIHVGLHKTGTTFLQEEIFPKLKGVKYYNLYQWKRKQQVFHLVFYETDFISTFQLLHLK